jgi:hypothetical protein
VGSIPIEGSNLIHTFMSTLIALIVLVILLGLVIYAQVNVVTRQENDLYDPFGEAEESTWTMHHTEYLNRYGDKIYFVQINSNQIQMTFESDYYRVAYANDDSDTDLYMVDPSGGPAIFVGTDMGSIYYVWRSCIVSSITQEHNKHYTLTFQKIEE